MLSPTRSPALPTLLLFTSLGVVPACALAHERPAPQQDAAVLAADGGVPDDAAAVAIDPPPRLSATWGHTCFVRADGVLYCWGQNLGNVLGLPGDATQSPYSPAPVRVDPDHRYRTIAAGILSSCGIRIDGSLVCWGAGVGSGLESDETTTRTTPVQIGSRRDWRRVEVGSGFACGLHEDDTLECWGGLGAPAPQLLATPTGVPGRFRDVSSGWYETIATTVDGQLLRAGEHGRFEPYPSEAPDTRFVAAAEGAREAVRFDEAGRAHVRSLDTERDLAADVRLPEPILRADASYEACAVTTSGRLFCFDVHSPSELPPLREIVLGAPVREVAVDGNNGTACALDASDQVSCWSTRPDGPYPPTPTLVSFE